jgi:hypothetical protein
MGLEQGIVSALVLLLGLGGVVNIAGPAPLRRDYARWGYPAWFGRVTGALLILAAVLITMPPLRLTGLGLAALVTLAALGTLLRAREFGHTPPSIVLLAVLGWLGWHAL